MQQTILNFCQSFDYPDEAKKALTEAAEKVETCQQFSLFSKLKEQYDADELPDFKAIWEPLDRVAESSGVSVYTVHLLFFMSCAGHLRELYREAEIPDMIWKDSMMDLKWKTLECYKLYQIWGIFVAFWYPPFFQLKLFALGRLEFEVIDLPDDYPGNPPLKKGAPVINVHIPSCGPLKTEDCMKSFTMAYDFFKKQNPEYFASKEELPFYCYSWLLFKKHEIFLPEQSNIRKFMNLFDIFKSWEDNTYHDFWRIFYQPQNAPREKIPCKTSLQKAYLKWMDEGNLPGVGMGLFYYNGKKIRKN